MFPRGVPAPTRAAHGLQSLRGACYSVESSVGGPSLRGPPSGIVYLYLCPQPCPLPRLAFVSFKTRLSLYHLTRLLSPSRRHAPLPLPPSPGGAAAAASGTTRSPDWPQRRRGGLLSSLSEPAGTGTGRCVASSTRHPAAPVTKPLLFIPTTAAQLR